MPPTIDKRAQAAPTDTLIGGRYRVIRLLGKGGMGAVFEAENTWTKRRVAVKVMRPEVAANADFMRRFTQEAQAASQLAHPNIVDVLDMGEDVELGSLYIVQEFLTGHDLRDHLDAAGRMPLREALELISPVMEALIMAHSRGIVHRDLKPDNIFLAETPRGIVPTLIDFGIAKVLTDDGRSCQETSYGALLGTPYYMAPEAGRGDTALDARADVWSLGVVLYELLSGLRPAHAATANALIAKIIYEDPKPLADAAPDLPLDVVSAIMGALQRDLTKRHPTMQAFLDALRACAVMREGAEPRAVSASLVLTATTPPPASVRSGSTPTPRQTSTGGTIAPMETTPHVARRKVPGLGVVGAVVGAGILVALLTFSLGARRPADVGPAARSVTLTIANPAPLVVPVAAAHATFPAAPAHEGLRAAGVAPVALPGVAPSARTARRPHAPSGHASRSTRPVRGESRDAHPATNPLAPVDSYPGL